MKLTGRVAIVTGAGGGIGAATAIEFAKEGARVHAVDRKADVSDVCSRIRAEGGQAVPWQLDITDNEAYAKCIAQVGQSEGKIDVLVTNAAIFYYEELLESSLEHWRSVQAVNLEAIYMGCRLTVPHMINRRSGRIVNVSSIQALATEARVGAYAASKGAIISFTKSLAVELAPHGINANAILPGCIRTPMSFIDGVDETTTENFKKWYVEQRKIPLARAGKPEEIARVAVFLASDDSSYITGHALVVDGGLTITF
jgi:3-oxoacyl-[acyl-carrier protein] reductase